MACHPTLGPLPSPTVGAFSADPFTVNEIDAHPDCDRIWATIMLLKEEHEQRLTEIEEKKCPDCLALDNE